ncbi:winged helix-turn-helix domain-containing protein [Methylobacter psychrophilus]|uniref:winged helix-turn-helix domain-containing protein n=1 Tax=Methylobacter psychrophilus TaxID=96941 RepID=UPI0021D4BDF3|nr:AAA family ATPase [Methylobacter psychrophilus]
MEQQNTYLFGQFRLDTFTQLLCNEESSVKLAPKVYRLLLYFLLHKGRLIPHEELFDAVWEGRIVDDSALRLAVNSLRNALQDASKSPNYIATVSKRGYRFMAEVSVKDHYLFAKTNLTNSLCYRPKAELFPAWFECTNELTCLQEAFQQASTGQRQLVFLTGEQGIGKTALLDIFLANVNSSRLSVLRARCVQMKGVTEPFLPLLEALERRCREPYGNLLIEQLSNLAPTWLYQMLTVLNPDERAMLQTKISPGNSGCILREGAHFFETLSGRSTLILVLDNSHWSDEFTLDLLNFLMFRCSAAKLLIIVSYRSSDNGSGMQRIAEMRAELFSRGLCQELSMLKRQN